MMFDVLDAKASVPHELEMQRILSQITYEDEGKKFKVSSTPLDSDDGESLGQYQSAVMQSLGR
jgi:hypothetical protein